MLENFVMSICLGCWPIPPLPPPPPPAQPPLCEGLVSSVRAQTASLMSRTSVSVTFRIADCRANYIYVGTGGPVLFTGVSGMVTVSDNPSRVSLGSSDTLRLYQVTSPTNAAQFTMRRTKVSALDPGITTGYFTTRRTATLLPFNQTLYERYERLVLSWPLGTQRRIWSGQSFADLSGNLSGALPRIINLWNVDHRIYRGSNLHLSQRMTEFSGTGPVLEPAGVAYELRDSATSSTYSISESVRGNAHTTSVTIGNTPLLLVVNLQPTNVTMSN